MVRTLKEKIALLKLTRKPIINQAARTLLDLPITWENTIPVEGKDLVSIKIQDDLRRDS
jgi:hypothetical protein